MAPEDVNASNISSAQKERILEFLSGALEPLRKELEEHKFKVPNLGYCIKHPLVFAVPYFETLNKHLNEALEYKLKARERALQSKDWYSYIFLYERPYRLEAFLEIMEDVPDPRYWELVREIWIDTENARQNYQNWLMIWNSDRGDREKNVMTKDEIKHLNSLPDQIKIYRGYSYKNAYHGFSWTLNKKRAEWFACRFAHKGKPKVAEITIDKSEVLAYFASRGEEEIIVNPMHRTERMRVYTVKVI